jgi:uncharacterized protein (DUF433 family)
MFEAYIERHRHVLGASYEGGCLRSDNDRSRQMRRKPCIRGLRIRVEDILSLLGAGASFEEILSDYPDLEPEDIVAALNYAATQAD